MFLLRFLVEKLNVVVLFFVMLYLHNDENVRVFTFFIGDVFLVFERRDTWLGCVVNLPLIEY